MSDLMMQDPLQSNSPSKPPQLKREHDSSDDFEHLEHELQMHHHSAAVKNDSPPSLFHQNGQQPPHQPLLDFGDSFGLSTNDAPLQQQHQQQTLGSLSSPGLLDNLLDDEDDEVGGGLVKPVPATPPPSADLEAAGLTSFADSNNHQKYNQGNEQFLNKKFDLDDLAVDDPMGAKASHTFVQNERRNFEVKRDDFSASPTYPSTGGGFDDDDDDDNSQLILGYKKHQIPEPNKNTPPALGQDNDDDEDDDTEPERSQSLGTPAHKPSNTNNIPANNKLGLDEDFDDDSLILVNKPSQQQQQHQPPKNLYDFEEEQEHHRVISSKLPEPEKSPELDFVKEEILVKEATKEKPVPWTMKAELEDAMMGAPTKPLPPPPVDDEFLAAETGNRQHRLSGGASDTGDSEFESEQEASPARSIGGKVQPPPVQVTKPQIGDVHERKTFIPPKNNTTTSSTRQKSRDEDEIAPKAIFRDIGIDAWFNPERLNPKVEALIYWRDPKKSGIVFGATLTVLLSLAYFSLISVVAYISLLTLTFTVVFRIYKTVLQAIQKTSDGHPFKDILDVDLTLPSEKVHEVADIAVANANAAVSELRRLFLVDDFVDSLKFGILLWSLTYLGSWFNGMTLIILGVIALFTLPKVYETNKTQIDQNLALVQAKINELTAKVKAAMPIGKKAEPAKEE